MRSSEHPDGGIVAEGFYSYYQTMVFSAPNGDKIGTAAHALAHLIPEDNARIFITGHSLGSALVSYLAYDLASMMNKPEHLNIYILPAHDRETALSQAIYAIPCPTMFW